jgi:TatD DNase family protein
MSSSTRRAIPRFDTPIVETHCHLDYLGDEALGSALQAAEDVGIERIVTIAVSADNLDTVRRIATDHDQVWCTQGIHPHEADSWSNELSERVTENLQQHKGRRNWRDWSRLSL